MVDEGRNQVRSWLHPKLSILGEPLGDKKRRHQLGFESWLHPATMSPAKHVPTATRWPTGLRSAARDVIDDEDIE